MSPRLYAHALDRARLIVVGWAASQPIATQLSGGGYASPPLRQVDSLFSTDVPFNFGNSLHPGDAGYEATGRAAANILLSFAPASEDAGVHVPLR